MDGDRFDIGYLANDLIKQLLDELRNRTLFSLPV